MSLFFFKGRGCTLYVLIFYLLSINIIKYIQYVISSFNFQAKNVSSFALFIERIKILDIMYFEKLRSFGNWNL